MNRTKRRQHHEAKEVQYIINDSRRNAFKSSREEEEEEDGLEALRFDHKDTVSIVGENLLCSCVDSYRSDQ